MSDGMSLREAARNLLRLHRQHPDLFDHVLPINAEEP